MCHKCMPRPGPLPHAGTKPERGHHHCIIFRDLHSAPKANDCNIFDISSLHLVDRPDLRASHVI